MKANARTGNPKRDLRRGLTKIKALTKAHVADREYALATSTYGSRTAGFTDHLARGWGSAAVRRVGRLRRYLRYAARDASYIETWASIRQPDRLSEALALSATVDAIARRTEDLLKACRSFPSTREWAGTVPWQRQTLLIADARQLIRAVLQ
jgi:hypothetical protein